jgi:hypothetical protein
VPIAGSADGSVGEAIEWCRYHPYEEGTDPELEGVMTTFVDQERPLESSVRRLHAKKWKDCLQAAEDDLPKSICDMLSPCETPWVTKVTTADRPDEEIYGEETDDGESYHKEIDDGESYGEDIDGEDIDGEETYTLRHLQLPLCTRRLTVIPRSPLSHLAQAFPQSL